MRRLIAFILMCALFLIFVVLNLENSSDVSFGFREFYAIPVFLIAFSSFVLGMLFAVPFVLSFGKKRKSAPQSPPSPPPDFHYEGGKKPPRTRKKFWNFRKKKDTPDSGKIERDAVSPPNNEINKESSPYGVG